jgi:uncharacterized protein YggE
MSQKFPPRVWLGYEGLTEYCESGDIDQALKFGAIATHNKQDWEYLSKQESDALVREAKKQAFEEAAKEAESWFEIFNFESFNDTDVRRVANPNHIASRIRHLAKAAEE